MMTSQLGPPPSEAGQLDRPRPLPARVSFRQPVAATGHIDAAWWPRSRDLTAELPALLDVLWTAAREVNRLTYYLHAWAPAPRRMQIEGRTVRLGGGSTRATRSPSGSATRGAGNGSTSSF